MTTKVQSWSVTVMVNGEPILTIESNHLSGIENIDEYGDVVRQCADHLASFIGPAKVDRELNGDGLPF